MVTEHPEDGRAWADGHAQWSAFAGGLYASVRGAFHTLAAIQFDAPWKAERAEARCEARAPSRSC